MKIYSAYDINKAKTLDNQNVYNSQDFIDVATEKHQDTTEDASNLSLGFKFRSLFRVLNN